MPSIAFHTLGCKVNQYDTQAMLELFQSAGYEIVPFSAPADIYLVNTCTVTGVGDKKSLQTARRLKREHPGCKLILCGCMAQSRPDDLLRAGADLVLGTQRRMEVVSLLEQVLRSGEPLCAVSPVSGAAVFEPLTISSQAEHTRAALKIQEGCDRRCSYCIIPDVRGPVRSRPLQEICLEAERLRDAGYRELVLTGIHLSSYGRDLPGSLTLLDVLSSLQQVSGILRIRLGSLEPTIVTPRFADALASLDKVCPQFHLALQSGSDSVLRRMRRRYNTEQYLRATETLRGAFPRNAPAADALSAESGATAGEPRALSGAGPAADVLPSETGGEFAETHAFSRAALTTDVLTGFPGETAEEFEETRAFLRKIGFARIHVFPYSPRPGTPAAEMPGQLTAAEKERRARILIADGQSMMDAWLRSWIGMETTMLPEEQAEGCWEGYTPEYIRVRLPAETSCESGRLLRIRLTGVFSGRMNAAVLP